MRKAHFAGVPVLKRIPRKASRDLVVVVRGILESIVSGYLYHKSGHECWLNDRGQPNNSLKHAAQRNDWLTRENWQSVIKRTKYPNPEGRNLCEALAHFEEEIGLSIYAEFALEHFVNSAIHLSVDSQDHDILFICLEDAMVDKRAFVSTVKKFQSGVGISEIEQRMRRAPTVSNYSYTGPHSTPEDTSLRRRLREIARRVDADLLDGKLQFAESIFRCSKQI